MPRKNTTPTVSGDFTAEKLTVQVEHNFTIIEERKEHRYAPPCKFCQSAKTMHTKVKDVYRCRACCSYYGDEFTFQFPQAAREKRSTFKRAFCLIFGIQSADARI